MATREREDRLEKLFAAGWTTDLFAEFWAAPDLKWVPSIITDDFVGYWPAGRIVRGKAACMQALEDLLALLPDLRLEVPEHTMSVNGEFGFSRWVMHATGANGPSSSTGWTALGCGTGSSARTTSASIRPSFSSSSADERLDDRPSGAKLEKVSTPTTPSAFARLVTLVDLADTAGRRRMSLSARHELELVDGRRLVLLDDRGWTSELRAGGVPDPEYSRDDELDIWTVTSVDEIQETARVVVGPDEPPDGRSLEAMEAAHWAHLSELLRQQGVVVDASDLMQLPHDVVPSERLLARLGQERGDAVSS